ncbi:CidA/LrgA family protein [Nocardioides stalactiti]|uniref:CidA/LrgA family protein n=1 Tax=Nocardioides stalactiti TaxID=2755356 RepID=UPI0016024800|nr:CidA/LrgA family protein [Nocardioides stalactiti]
MIVGLTWLIAFQLLGEVTVQVLDLTVPGPVVGMLYLFVFLRLRQPAADAPVLRAGTGLLRHLQLFFIPAGVGIVASFGVIGADWLPILVAMLGSWFLGLAVVGWTSTGLERLLGQPRDDQPRTPRAAR